MGPLGSRPRDGTLKPCPARTPRPTITAEQRDEMFKTLLADRFHLILHHETKELPVYDLVVAKGGSRLRPSGDEPGFGMTDTGSITFKKTTVSTFANVLSGVPGTQSHRQDPPPRQLQRRSVLDPGRSRRRPPGRRWTVYLHRPPGAARPAPPIFEGPRRGPGHRPRRKAGRELIRSDLSGANITGPAGAVRSGALPVAFQDGL